MKYSTFYSSGIRELNFDLDDESILFLKEEWRNYLDSVPVYPSSKFHGKGIVMCAGGLQYFTCAWIAIKNLRSIGCQLPIELWYLGAELTGEVIEKLSSESVFCKNFLDYTNTELSGLMLKPLAIIYSQFEEVLFLDADNNCIIDPVFLFNAREYLEFGAIFWPDYWHTSIKNPIWKIIETDNYLTKEQESGQILINKRMCWKELNLCMFFNERHQVYHKLLYGDKDTFKFAWLALKSPFYMIKSDVSNCGFLGPSGEFLGVTMVQHGPDGEILFLHRNLLKWDISLPDEKVWKVLRKFKKDAKEKIFLLKGYSMGILGDYEEFEVPYNVKNLENECLKILQDLRASVFYQKFLIYCHIRKDRHKLMFFDKTKLELSVKKSNKFFNEAGGGHYDIRFYRQLVEPTICQEILLKALGAFSEVCVNTDVKPILMHGALIGWKWNKKLLPWDDDIDLCVTYDDLLRLEAALQANEVIYNEDKYLLEINPNHINRNSLNHNNNDWTEPNKIDARFIDRQTGLFLDITALYPIGGGRLATKCPHVYQATNIFPLQQSILDGMKVYLPANVSEVLTQEYGVEVLIKKTFGEYFFNEENDRWELNNTQTLS